MIKFGSFWWDLTWMVYWFILNWTDIPKIVPNNDNNLSIFIIDRLLGFMKYQNAYDNHEHLPISYPANGYFPKTDAHTLNG